MPHTNWVAMFIADMFFFCFNCYYDKKYFECPKCEMIFGSTAWKHKAQHSQTLIN